MLLASLFMFAAPMPMVADVKYGQVGKWAIRKGEGRCYIFDGSETSQIVIITQGGGGSIALSFDAEPTKRLQAQLAGATQLVLSWSGPTEADKTFSEHPVADMQAAVTQLDDCARWFS